MIALQALMMISEEGKLSHIVINDALNKYDYIDKRDKALLVRLIHGSLEYQIQSDYIINLFSKVKTEKMKPVIRNILRLSVYQLMHTDKIPDSAVCDEAVKLTKKKSMQGLSGFVNGVLRNISRNKDSIDISGRDIRYSVPKWLLGILDETIGEKAADNYLEYTLSEHGLWIRNLKTGKQEHYDKASELFSSKEWIDGNLIVQDYSSSMPVSYSSMREGDIVYDVCSAPGGKSIQAAGVVRDRGRVYAFDINDKKVSLIQENIKRTGYKNIETVVGDATVYNPELKDGCDILIADLPCSGLGTLSGKPDVKNRLKIEDLLSLAGIQKTILNNVCNYVRPGGELVFSTCTIDYRENEDNVKAFLESHSNFELLKEEQLLPSEKPMDGFFIAVMRRVC